MKRQWMWMLVLTGLMLSSGAIAQNRTPNFGLGMPRTAGTGGATRGDGQKVILPRVLVLVPEDGARTLSPRPALYWYVSPDDVDTPFAMTFFLRESPEQTARTLFRTTAKLTDAGLYRMTLTEPQPALAAGTVHRWQVRWQSGNRASQFDVNALVRYEPNPGVEQLVKSLPTRLQRARVLVKNGYWYDALDVYTQWLMENPTDSVARGERDELIKQGFSSHSRIKAEELPLLIRALSGSINSMPVVKP
ncbi:MAG: DUF928 domain-containing protein [Oscillatoriales cyanobacterium SM2_2_1]|nr:DUF928 domain-containing protein [Oscillatoriales cyanobacterium SM2_2_1]